MNAATARVLGKLSGMWSAGEDGVWHGPCPACGGPLTVRERRADLMPVIQCGHRCPVDVIRRQAGITLADHMLRDSERDGPRLAIVAPSVNGSDDDDTSPHRTDVGNGKRLASRHGR